jgi:hydroxymethylpyrimidine kinase/phosphomethylpyrimidine kinase/thiamine-phosphate diphosphorylase
MDTVINTTLNNEVDNWAMSDRRPIVWSIAGSDSGAGAGVQADLKAFEAFDVHGCTAIAAVTAQNSRTVAHIVPLAPELLQAQLDALAGDLAPAALKLGLLGSVANLEVVLACVQRLRAAQPGLPLVVDPVLRASTGAALADSALVAAYVQRLLPLTCLLTPNRAEAAALLGLAAPLRARAEVEQAAAALRRAGAQAVVITGGDAGGGDSEDYLDSALAQGWLRLPRVATPHQHGTGCVFAASAAAAMGRGYVDAEAVVLAKMATTHALRRGYAAGAGAGPVRPGSGFGLSADNLPMLSLPPGTTTQAALLAAPQATSQAVQQGTSRAVQQAARQAPEQAMQPFAPLAAPDMGLYAIVDSAAWVRRVLAGGVRTVQLRIKDAGHPRLRDEVRDSVQAARAVGAQLFINDHWALALQEQAYGVHLGQEDLATADLAALAAAGLRLGVSTHAYWEVCRARALKPSYIACGPVHPTAAKAMPWIAQGDGNLAYWCRLLQGTPVVAIGGMDVARAQAARRAGAAGVAVLGGITQAAEPERAMQALLAAAAEPMRRADVCPPWARPTLAAAG